MDPTATAGDLLYVSTSPFQAVPDVEVYSWERRELVGVLMGFHSPAHLCADKAGNVFVPDTSTAQIFEFAHGGTNPIATLHDTGHTPRACSADRVTGDLAVVDGTEGGGDIAIYRNASGNPTRHLNTRFATYDFCGYDDAGNLFVDGKDHSGNFRFAEIPHGSKFLMDVTLDTYIITPGSVQWDGKYMAVGDEVGDFVFQFAITGSTGTLKGRTDLYGGQGPVHQFWIPELRKRKVTPQDRHIVAAQFHFSRFDFGDVGYWSYPAGGPATHVIVGPDHPLGVTVSIGTK